MESECEGDRRVKMRLRDEVENDGSNLSSLETYLLSGESLSCFCIGGRVYAWEEEGDHEHCERERRRKSDDGGNQKSYAAVVSSTVFGRCERMAGGYVHPRDTPGRLLCCAPHGPSPASSSVAWIAPN